MVTSAEDGPNAEEAKYWSSPTGLSWIENEDILDTLMAPISEAALKAAGLARVMSVLDIGCGTGAHAMAAANMAGPDGQVLAVDISPPLLARARERAERQRGGAPISVLNADAQVADFSNYTFDLATSRFGVMFFADPAAAFANIARPLRPGGRMLFAVWGPVSVNPWWRLPSSIAGERLGALPVSAPNSTGPMGLSDVGYVEDQLGKAGFETFSVTPTSVGLQHSAGAASMAALSMRVGPAARAMRLFDGTASDAVAIEEALARAYESYEDENGFLMPVTINMIDVQVP